MSDERKKTCLIYARCSTRDQETENQLVQLREFAGSKGWTVVEELVDICSGTKRSQDRPGMDRMFDMARRRKFDVLLFWALDRFSREGSRKTIKYLAELDEAGVGWHSYKEEYISSMGPFSDAIISILSTLAKLERDRISDRTKAGLERVRRNGVRLGRPAIDPERVAQAKALRASEEPPMSYSKIGEAMGITRAWAHKLVTAR